jgi:uncharacterized membrane protein (DUF4010 family)
LALALLWYLWPPALIGLVVMLAVSRRSTSGPDVGTAPDSPLQLRAALQMTGLFQLVLFVILWVQARWSADALVATSVFVGLTDVDALTLSLARSTKDAAALDAVAIALAAGVLSNTLLKMTVATVVGRGAFRAVTAITLGAMAASILAAIVM